MTQEPGRIGRYDIQSVLGRGAMGVVYKAHDPEIDRSVAIKLVHADLLHGEDRDDFTARFRREAQAAARCAHPNVVAVYDFALHEGNPFLAMEYIDGVTLAATRATGQRMPPSQAVGIIVEVLAGLAAAHATGITHRDVKPANIILARGGGVKVTDFGISRVDASSLTGTGMLVGTPSYMSPEQCLGEAADPRSDLYSTGVMLFELLAGVRPFAGASAATLQQRIIGEDAPDVRERCPDIPTALAEAVARSLSRNREARFASAAKMIDALRASLGVAVSGDHTVLLPARSPAAALDPDTVSTIERKLVEHVGPIARLLVQSAVRQTSDVESLCSALAAQIERPDERARFAREVRATLRTTASGIRAGNGSALRSGPGAGFHLAPDEAERLHAALTRYVGPVARVLIKRALDRANSLPALWQVLAEHIDDPRDRSAFRRAGPDEVR